MQPFDDDDCPWCDWGEPPCKCMDDQMELETMYAVVAHSDGVDKGGYVVRKRVDGLLPRGYETATILAEFLDRDSAQETATKLFRKACGR